MKSCARQVKFILFFVLSISPLVVLSSDTISCVPNRIYLEFIGHNFLSYQTNEKIPLSVNYSRELQLRREQIFGIVSVGWGMFLEKHSRQMPGFPLEHYYSVVSYVPVETCVKFKVGQKHNFIEVGGAVVFAFGEHWVTYKRGQSSLTRALNGGRQYIAIAGYSHYAESGLLLRIAITPHFIDTSLRSYEGHYLDKDFWIPVGLSLGYAF